MTTDRSATAELPMAWPPKSTVAPFSVKTESVVVLAVVLIISLLMVTAAPPRKFKFITPSPAPGAVPVAVAPPERLPIVAVHVLPSALPSVKFPVMFAEPPLVVASLLPTCTLAAVSVPLSKTNVPVPWLVPPFPALLLADDQVVQVERAGVAG